MRELGLSKAFEIHVFRMSDSSEFSFFPSRLGSLTLKQVCFEDVYLPPVASEASGGCILNTKQLHYLEQLLNTNQQFF